MCGQINANIYSDPSNHKRLLLVYCSVCVVVIQHSTPCQQTSNYCTVYLVWLALKAKEIPYASTGARVVRIGDHASVLPSHKSFSCE